MIKAIETAYKGYNFRSRLEARWAVFFDALGIEWEYEPEGFEFEDGTRYLPDFLLKKGSKHTAESLSGREFSNVVESLLLADTRVYVEIKGTQPTSEELEKLEKLCIGTATNCYLYAGAPGKQETYFSLFDLGQNGEIVAVSGKQNTYGKEALNTVYLAFELGKFGNLAGGDFWEKNIHLVRVAEIAARSARFEHGAKGY
jgi:hypothetical protein